MAVKRMISNLVVDTDMFLDMPASTQNLYFHFNLKADDDGFLASPKKVMRAVGGTTDDMRVLEMKGYIIPFESGIIVIRHWRMHNTIQNDRYHPTVHCTERDQLLITENGAYLTKEEALAHGIPVEIPTLSGACAKMDTDCIHDVSEMDTQTRLDIDKTRLDKKSNLRKEHEQEFEELWKLYPRKRGKDRALKAYIAARKAGTSEEEVEAGIRAYKAEIARKHTDPQYIMHGSTWFTQHRWEDDYETGGKGNEGYTGNNDYSISGRGLKAADY